MRNHNLYLTLCKCKDQASSQQTVSTLAGILTLSLTITPCCVLQHCSPVSSGSPVKESFKMTPLSGGVTLQPPFSQAEGNPTKTPGEIQEGNLHCHPTSANRVTLS